MGEYHLIQAEQIGGGYKYNLQNDDYKAAAKCFRKAARNGEAYAQSRLGDCYAEGKGVEQSRETALYWYKKAAAQEPSADDNGAERDAIEHARREVDFKVN